MYRSGTRTGTAGSGTASDSVALPIGTADRPVDARRHAHDMTCVMRHVLFDMRRRAHDSTAHDDWFVNAMPAPLSRTRQLLDQQAPNNSADLSKRLIRAMNRWRRPDFEVADVEMLLADGADVNGLCGTLRPLHFCCMAGNSDGMALLINHGADVDAVDAYGRTALHYAAEKDVACVAGLLAAGAPVDTQDAGGDTPLHWAVYRDNVTCARRLLAHGAHVDFTDFLGNTPLSWGVTRNSHDCVVLLLEYNADVQTVIPSPDLATRVHHRLASLRGPLDAASLSACAAPDRHQPCSLHQLCRFTIRRSLGRCFLPAIVLSLPIPTHLQRFLLFG